MSEVPPAGGAPLPPQAVSSQGSPPKIEEVKTDAVASSVLEGAGAATAASSSAAVPAKTTVGELQDPSAYAGMELKALKQERAKVKTQIASAKNGDKSALIKNKSLLDGWITVKEAHIAVNKGLLVQKSPDELAKIFQAACALVNSGLLREYHFFKNFN